MCSKSLARLWPKPENLPVWNLGPSVIRTYSLASLCPSAGYLRLLGGIGSGGFGSPSFQFSRAAASPYGAPHPPPAEQPSPCQRGRSRWRSSQQPSRPHCSLSSYFWPLGPRRERRTDHVALQTLDVLDKDVELCSGTGKPPFGREWPSLRWSQAKEISHWRVGTQIPLADITDIKMSVVRTIGTLRTAKRLESRSNLDHAFKQYLKDATNRQLQRDHLVFAID
jgi:hypothetical protein